MGHTTCTDPQCLYSTAIPLLPLWAIRPVQSLSACTVQLYLYSPYGPYSLYRASGCTLTFFFFITVLVSHLWISISDGRREAKTYVQLNTYTLCLHHITNHLYDISTHTHNWHHAMLTCDDLDGHILQKQMRMLLCESTCTIPAIPKKNPYLVQSIIKQLHNYKHSIFGNWSFHSECTQCSLLVR